LNNLFFSYPASYQTLARELFQQYPYLPEAMKLSDEEAEVV